MASGISTDSVPGSNSSSYRAKEKCDSSAIPNDSDSYRLSGNPLGLCVILNYKTFLKDSHRKREGSENDVQRLQPSFESLGFLVIVKQDLSKAQTEEFFTKLLEDDIKESHSIFALCVMSHGNNKHVFTSDCKELDYMRHIVDRFCVKKLKDVPKLFFFQFCRGNKTEMVSTDGPAPDTDSSGYVESFRRNRFVGYSVVDGFTSFRDHSSGSWYIQAWCDVLDNFEEGVEFRELARRVSEIVQNKKAEGATQTNENLENLPKKLYLRRPNNSGRLRTIEDFVRDSNRDRLREYKQALLQKCRDLEKCNNLLENCLTRLGVFALVFTITEELKTSPLSLLIKKVDNEIGDVFRNCSVVICDSHATSQNAWRTAIHIERLARKNEHRSFIYDDDDEFERLREATQNIRQRIKQNEVKAEQVERRLRDYSHCAEELLKQVEREQRNEAETCCIL